MDAKQTVELLNALRLGWSAKRTDPYFEDRGEWLAGVIEGIDLAIWTIRTQQQRLGAGRGSSESL